ncbi:MAG: DUF4911 domain-containing protein [Desulfobulbaceae bacterium]|nr:DUF4911 domain-containing protein [Desulfobulbaceae bacterium]
MFEFARLQLRMAPERIHFLKFILEGYDHLAMQSTVDVRQGLVELRFPVMSEGEVRALLEQLTPSLGTAPVLEVT